MEKTRELVRASVRPDKDEETVQEEKKRERRPLLLAISFVREKTRPDSRVGIEELCDRIYSGVLMKDKKERYKQLSIVWIENERYWTWISEEEKCFSGKVDLPAAMLLQVCWLNISGTFRTIKLSPKTTYEVAFVVKMSKHSRGWHAPVNLNLTLPDGTTLGRMENLEEKQKEEWIEIFVGTFTTTPENVGKISFSFSENGGHWKSGLIIKGIVLRPRD